MREREDHGERVHQRVWELLPWYANGSLAERERERVEAHLAACPRCQEEERICRRTAGRRGAEPARWPPRPHPVQLQRMLARIEESESEEQESAGGWRLLAPSAPLVRATPRPLRWALVAQAAVILLLVGLLAWSARAAGAAAPARQPPPTGRCRTRPRRRSVHPPAGDVLAPGDGAGDPRASCRASRARSPPAPRRWAPIRSRSPPPAIRPAVVLARLRSEPRLVMFAEPAAGGPGEGRPVSRRPPGRRARRPARRSAPALGCASALRLRPPVRRRRSRRPAPPTGR